MNEYLEVEGRLCLRMQQKDARLILGISHTIFNADSKKYAWHKDEGPGNAVFYYVPKEYVERRQLEKQQKEALLKHDQAQVDQPVASQTGRVESHVDQPVAQQKMNLPPDMPTVDQPVARYATPPEPLAAVPEINTLINQLQQFQDNQAKLYETLISELKSQNTMLKTQNEMLNREIENRNYQIQKYREQERTQPSRAWWAFWKSLPKS